MCFHATGHMARWCCLLLLALVLCAGAARGRTVRLDYIGDNPLHNGKPARDTIGLVPLTKRLDWNVVITDAAGKVTRLQTSRPDTVTLAGQVSVQLTSEFTVAPALVNNIFYIGYSVTGSAIIRLNGEELVRTGIYNPKKPHSHYLLKEDEYVKIVLHDTANRLEVLYTSHPYTPYISLGLSIAQVKYADRNTARSDRGTNEGFALGFYYLSFGIIFMFIFLFLRERTENLYFSLFCLCASVAFLWGSVVPNILYPGDDFFCLLALEFLSIFFAKVICSRNKTKIPLLIMVIVAISALHPYVMYSSISVFGGNVPLQFLAMFVIMGGYSSISSCYYLILGIGQKRWEARAIVLIISSAIILFFVVPIVFISVVSASHPDALIRVQSVIHALITIGLCIYPLSAVIVLGRRNGLNQKQLADQVKAIGQLSEANIQKEKEKQQLLEDQKTDLEHKVKERTYEVERQKELIELKNKAITDNINYAQRIQSAILPDIQLIYKALTQSFILFEPKDIVSGDFYAFAEKNDRVLIIAGDCTGHGVSGAFMSMIGSSLLNQIINEKGVEEPALILNHLNTAVIESLKQNVTESNDGMDISICSLDISRRTLQYAGANRPLWLLRNNAIEVYKPDKFPIGGLQAARDRTFTNYTIPLQKNDTLYIFTDGYADQFGGAAGKKMMTSKFKEMLLAIQGMSMREQEQHLRSHLENWKGDLEQVDDVLVIGVRV